MDSDDVGVPEHHELSKITLLECVNAIIESDGVVPFRREDVKAAVPLLMEAAKHFEATVFSDSDNELRAKGPCLICFSEMVYLKFSGAHLRYREVWFRKVLKQAKLRPGMITFDQYLLDLGRTVRIGKYQWNQIRHYVCSQCAARVNELFSKHKADKEVEREQQHKEAEDHHRQRIARDTEWAIGACRISEGPLKYWDHHTRLRNCSSETLAALPYAEFLKSRYWKTVKNQVLNRDGYRCSLCSQKDKLIDVHHKTYDHHGKEHAFLDDLISLCRTCHSKFHEKLA